MSSRSSNNWRDDYEKELRTLIRKRNYKASKLNKEGKSINAVKIIPLKEKDVLNSVITKADAARQMKALRTFLNSKTEFKNYGTVTINEAYEKELNERVRFNNSRAKKESSFARSLSKKPTVGGSDEYDTVAMGNIRYKGKVYTQRDLSQIKELSRFEAYRDAVMANSLVTTSIKKWEPYKENYIKAFEKNFFELNSDGTLKLDENGNPIPLYDAISKDIFDTYEKIKNTSLTKFRDAYYGDWLGDIDYVYSGDNLEVYSEKLASFNKMF